MFKYYAANTLIWKVNWKLHTINIYTMKDLIKYFFGKNLVSFIILQATRIEFLCTIVLFNFKHFQLLERSLWCWVHICFHIIPIYLSPFCLLDSNRASLLPVPHDSTSNIYWQSACHQCFLQAKLPQVLAVSESMEYGNTDDVPFIFKATNTCFRY